MTEAQRIPPFVLQVLARIVIAFAFLAAGTASANAQQATDSARVSPAGSTAAPSAWEVAIDSSAGRGRTMLLVSWATRGDGAEPGDVRLVLRCQQQKLDAVVFLGWRVLADTNGVAPMRIQWDTAPFENSSWHTSSDRRAVFAMSPTRFIDQGLARHSLLYLQAVRELAQEPHELVTFEFDMMGLSEHLIPLRKECPDAGWSALPAYVTKENPRDSVYFEFHVDRPVENLKAAELVYPEELRQQNVQGSVLVQFVVDVNGRANLSTLKVLRTTHPLFVESVKQFLLFARYRPAELNGRAVRQLVQQPFNFRLTPAERMP